MNTEMSNEPIHELLHTMFPNLDIHHVSKLGTGWDSIALLINESLVFRIPKRPEVSRQMAKEIRVLEAIRPYVSVEIPKIEWIGPTYEQYVVSAVGYHKLIGQPLSNIEPGPVRNRVLKQVAVFLTELHTIPMTVLNKVGIPWFRWTGELSGSNPTSWEEGIRGFSDRILSDVVPLLNSSVGNRVTKTVSKFLSCTQNFQFEPVLLHGDLAPEHILVHTETNTISVIDFGDCGFGDPAYDISADLLPFYRYKTDSSFLERQLFYRKIAPFHGVLYGQMIGDETLVENGLRQINKEFM